MDPKAMAAEEEERIRDAQARIEELRARVRIILHSLTHYSLLSAPSSLYADFDTSILSFRKTP